METSDAMPWLLLRASVSNAGRKTASKIKPGAFARGSCTDRLGFVRNSVPDNLFLEMDPHLWTDDLRKPRPTPQRLASAFLVPEFGAGERTVAM